LPANSVLLTRQERLGALIDTLPLWFWRMEQDWRMTEVGDSFTWAAGIEPSELVGLVLS